MSKCHMITLSMRLEGFAKPISSNQQDLQRRFDRWLHKTKGFVQDAADAEECAEKAESLADAAQERMRLKDRVISKEKIMNNFVLYTRKQLTSNDVPANLSHMPFRVGRCSCPHEVDKERIYSHPANKYPADLLLASNASNDVTRDRVKSPVPEIV